jgi:hypothetical protein
MDDTVVENMRARIVQCRRLADLIHNPEVTRTLLQMADDIEADLKRLDDEKRPAG